MELILTLVALFTAVAVAVLARRRARQPAEPLKVRLMDYNYVVILAILVIVVILARLLAMTAGHL